MSDETILAEARNRDGSQRFYPPYEHPAVHQVREQLKLLERHTDREALPYTTPADEAIAYCLQKLIEFEAGEERAKRVYMARIQL
jgi:hypothetical protein